MYFPPQPFSAEILVSAAVSVVFRGSTCPVVPTFTWGLVRSNLALAMAPCPLEFRVKTEGRKDGTTEGRRRSSVVFPSFPPCVFPSPSSSRAELNRLPHPYQGCALPTELRERHLGRSGGRAERGPTPDAHLPPFRLSAFPTSSSGRRDSNPRPSAWKADALPTELHPRRTQRRNDAKFSVTALLPPHLATLRLCVLASSHGGGRIRTFVGRSPADLQSAAISHSATPPTTPLHAPTDTEPRRASGVSGAGSAHLRHWS